MTLSEIEGGAGSSAREDCLMASEQRLKGKSKGLAGEVGRSWSWIMCWMTKPGGSLAEQRRRAGGGLGGGRASTWISAENCLGGAGSV